MQLPELPEGYRGVPYGGSSYCISKNYEYIRDWRNRVKTFRSPERAVKFCWEDATKEKK